MCAGPVYYTQNDDDDDDINDGIAMRQRRPAAMAVNDVAAADAPIRRAQQCGR